MNFDLEAQSGTRICSRPRRRYVGADRLLTVLLAAALIILGLSVTAAATALAPAADGVVETESASFTGGGGEASSSSYDHAGTTASHNDAIGECSDAWRASGSAERVPGPTTPRFSSTTQQSPMGVARCAMTALGAATEGVVGDANASHSGHADDILRLSGHGVHTYYVLVGEQSVLVHNCGTGGAIGFSDDAVGSAFDGMNSGGGHAIRHLRDEAGLIANRRSLASQVADFQRLTSPILRSPTHTFDWRVGDTAARGFAGMVQGQQVVVFVAKEGLYQRRVLTAVVPRGNQGSMWGLR